MVFFILFIFYALMSLLNIICISATPTQPTEVDYGGKIAFFRRKISRPDDLRARTCWRWALQSLPKSKLVFALMTFFAWTPFNFFALTRVARKSRLSNSYSITENTGSRRLIDNVYIIVWIILVCFHRIHSEQLCLREDTHFVFLQ